MLTDIKALTIVHLSPIPNEIESDLPLIIAQVLFIKKK